jgi:hypothetical protein
MPGNSRRSSMAADSFTALPEDGADRSGICLTDDEHRWSMGRRGVASNPDLPTDVPASTAKEINHGR